MPNRRGRRKQPKGRRPSARMMRSPQNLGLSSRPSGVGPVFRFKRTFLTPLTLLPATEYLGNYVAGLGATSSGFITFIQVYDLFRITKVKLTFVPHWNVNGTNAVAADDELPLITWVQNHDDFGTPTSFLQVQGFISSKTQLFDRPRSVTGVPTGLINIAATGGNSNGVILPLMWMNTSGNLVVMPFLKFAIQAVTGVPASGRFDILAEYTFEMCQATTQ